MAAATQYELFGSDSEEDDEPPMTAQRYEGSVVQDDGDAGDDDDVGDLFGSDDEGASADEDEDDARAAMLPSAQPVHVALPVQPRPAADSQLFLVRLPNILKFQPRPFDPESFENEEDDERGGGAAAAAAKGAVANVIRWRETPNGDRQSNARLVKWSDGSMTLHVGSEALTAQQISMPEGSTHLYAKHRNSALECHGVLRHKLTLAPASRHSKTHQALSKDIARQHTKTKRIQTYTTTEDPEKKKAEDERAWDDSRRLAMRQGQRRSRAEEQAEAPNLTTDFLDADDDDAPLEGNLGALRQQFKQRTRGGARGSRGAKGGRGGRATGGKRRRARRGSDDEEESEEEEEEESEEEEAEPGEMDDFIVAGSESEENDEGSEEEYGKKAKRKVKNERKKARLVEDSDGDD